MQKTIFLILLLSISIYAKNINIAVAANVSYAINELKNKFNEKHPNINVNIILGSSGKLSTQIINKAPYDVFMSANMNYPNELYKRGLSTKKAKIYAKGALAILSTKKLDLAKGINVIKNKSIKRIAIGNPKTAPYGKASKEVLENTNLYNDISKKLIYGESISQTVSYTLNASDLGFVAKSLLFDKKMKRFKENIDWIEVNKDLYKPIEQGIVVLKSSKNIKDANHFYDFIFSSEAKKIFKKYGYIINE